MTERYRHAGAGPAVALGLALAACVPSVREVEAPVRTTLRTRAGEEPGDAAAARAALARPLTRDAVRRLALVSPRAGAALATVGVAAGEAAAQRGLGHTALELESYFTDSGSLLGGHVTVHHDILDLVLMAPRRRAGGARLSAAQARAAGELIALAAEAELAFPELAGAAETAAAARTIFDAAAAAADLTERIHAAGGTTDLALAREQVRREEARLALARAEAATEAAREELNAVLGLSGADTRWTLGDGVPELPAAPPALDDLEATAVATSLALAALRSDAVAAANRAREAGVKAWLPSLAVGVTAEYHDGGWFPGPAVSLGLPLVSGERGRAAAARADGQRVAALTTATAAELRARARAARLRALVAFDEARHLRDVLVPLRRRVLDETLLQYNAMNASPFELLAVRGELAASELALVDARRRFAAAMVAVESLRRGVTVGGHGAAVVAPAPSSPASGGGHRGGH